MKKPFLIVNLFITLSFKLLAQNNCANNIEIADKYLDNGRVIDAIIIVKPCSNDVNNLSRWQAYRILSIAAILQDQNDSALYFARQMLALNPLYKINILKDPKDFTNLLKQINIIPKFSLGLSFIYGGCISIPRITSTYSPINNTKKYTNKTGYQFGLVTGYNFNKKSGIDINLIATSKKYSIEFASSGSSVKLNETLNCLDIPLLYRYTFFPLKRFRINVMVGPYGSFLLNSYNDLSLKDTTQNLDVKRYNSKIRRNIFNYGFVGGAGLIYKVGDGHISFDLRYYKSFSNITNASGRYENATLIYDYSYLDDDVKLDNITFSIGYQLYINYKLTK